VSLGIEEQFYSRVAHRAAGAMAAQAQSCVHRSRGSLQPPFALNIVFMHTDPKAAFTCPWTRFWELGLGCLLAVLRIPQAGSRGARAGEANGASWHRFRQIGGAALPVLGFLR